jgi:hypothetical protein
VGRVRDDGDSGESGTTGMSRRGSPPTVDRSERDGPDAEGCDPQDIGRIEAEAKTQKANFMPAA